MMKNPKFYAYSKYISEWDRTIIRIIVYDGIGCGSSSTEVFVYWPGALKDDELADICKDTARDTYSRVFDK